MYKTITQNKFRQLRTQQNITILAIESSCDETSVAIVKNGTEVLSCVICSQIDIHTRFGGVVPEIASRNHTMAIINVLSEALEQCSLAIGDIDCIAVTYGAGLIGALLVGVSCAKAISYSYNIPLVFVSHIEGHIATAYLSCPNLQLPFISVVASGGHSSIVAVEGREKFTTLASSSDDAIGECLDKVARLLGIDYPGGKNMDALCRSGSCDLVLPTHRDIHAISYSGLKTAAINHINKLRQKGESISIANIGRSVTVRAVDMLLDTAFVYLKECGYSTIAICGGVSANSYMRERVATRAKQGGYNVVIPELINCTDNASMIAVRAYLSVREGTHLADLTLNARSTVSDLCVQ